MALFKKILIVCTANVCRSPMAERLLRRHLSHTDIEVTSAGVAAMPGRPMDPVSADILSEHGIDDATPHEAKQVTSALLRRSELVLVMEQSHSTAISRIAPEASGKVFLLDKWQSGQDIPDPHRQQRIAYEHVFRLIDGSISAWLRYL
jgi:protein-tyrosine phosphatase